MASSTLPRRGASARYSWRGVLEYWGDGGSSTMIYSFRLLRDSDGLPLDCRSLLSISRAGEGARAFLLEVLFLEELLTAVAIPGLGEGVLAFLVGVLSFKNVSFVGDS